MDNDTLQYMYELMLERIPEPSMNKKVWSEKCCRLGVCLIEFRKHNYMKSVLYNMCNIYGGTDTTLYIIHGTENELFVKDIIKDWSNVRTIKYDHNNIDIARYNDIMTSYDFYNRFETEFVLIFQTDTIIRKQIPEEFFQYKYVGAPWKGYPNDFPDNPHIQLGNKLVGNGGFSLRHVEKMKEICSKYLYQNSEKKINEDVFITNYLNAFDVPKVELAKQFAVEWIFFEDPVGLHHVWSIFPFDIVKQWMQYIIE
jgi:hypothetical protein